jgi:hypothetical protein
LKRRAVLQAGPESHLCPVCFEQYASPGVLPRILGCGHTFCEPCLRKMLAPLLADGGAKVPHNQYTLYTLSPLSLRLACHGSWTDGNSLKF